MPETFTERLEFPFPVNTRSGVAAGVRALAERLWRGNRLSGRTVSNAELAGELESGGRWRLERRLPRPTANAEGLASMLLSALAATGSAGAGRWPGGALLDLSLTVSGIEREAGRQASVWQPERVTALPEVSGVERLATLSPASPLPERRWAVGSALKPLSVPVSAGVRAGAGGAPVEVQSRSGHWRTVRQTVDRWDVDTEWWTSQPVRRCYWRLALSDGGLATVYRDLVAGAWFRHGV